MKILLVAINAKYIHSNLAVYSLKAYSREYSTNVEIANSTINNREEQIIKDIYKSGADVIAFSTYIWNVDMVHLIATELKKVMPNVHIWLGGPEVSYDALNVLESHNYLDGIMMGEGEATFYELAKHYVDGAIEFSDIAGIAYRSENGVLANSMRPLMNMDDITFVYSDLQEFDNRIIYYESSRGCPYSCSYCLSSIDKSVRFRSLELVKKELQFFLDNKVKQVKFVDRTFNCKREHTMGIWQYILENDNGVTNFHFEIAANLLNDEELCLISKMRPGLIQLEIGVQSTNEKTIECIDRKIEFEQIKRVVTKVNSFGNIHQHLDLIAGLPYEDYESFKNSFNEVYALEPEQLQLGFLKVLKGSNMQMRAKEYELVYKDRAPYEVMSTKWLDFSKMLCLKNVEEMLETYYNSGQYRYTVKFLEKSFATPYDMYFALSEYYEKNGLYDVKHSRISRYTHLYEFAKSVDATNEQVYAKLLTYDLYLREKLKTRPAFAIDQVEHKQTIRELYDTVFADYKNKMTHLELVDIDVTTGKNIEPRWYLFDYTVRNPLNDDAKVIICEKM